MSRAVGAAAAARSGRRLITAETALDKEQKDERILIHSFHLGMYLID